MPQATRDRIYSLRLLLGGLLGGVVSNLSGMALGALVLQAEASRLFRSMENPPSPVRVLVEHVLIRFGTGMAAAWLYVMIRPRFGTVPKAVLATATFLWIVTYLFTALLLEELRIYTARTATLGAVWGYAELLLVVGAVAWVFRKNVD